MGYVPSTSKVTLEAYLTQKGRYFLVFSGTTQEITIKYFGLGDPDCNYFISSNDIGGGNKNILPSGSISDISGDHDCIKSLTTEKQRYTLSDPDINNNNNFINFNTI